MINPVLKALFAICTLSAAASCAPTPPTASVGVENAITETQARDILEDFGFIRIAQSVRPKIESELGDVYGDGAENRARMAELFEKHLSTEQLVTLLVLEVSKSISVDHLAALRARTAGEKFEQRIERELKSFIGNDRADDPADPTAAELAELMKNPNFRRYLEQDQLIGISDLLDSMSRQMAEGVAEAMRELGKLPDGGSVRAVRYAETYMYDEFSSTDRARVEKSAARNFLESSPAYVIERTEFVESPEGRALIRAFFLCVQCMDRPVRA